MKTQKKKIMVIHAQKYERKTYFAKIKIWVVQLKKKTSQNVGTIITRAEVIDHRIVSPVFRPSKL